MDIDRDLETFIDAESAAVRVDRLDLAVEAPRGGIGGAAERTALGMPESCLHKRAVRKAGVLRDDSRRTRTKQQLGSGNTSRN